MIIDCAYYRDGLRQHVGAMSVEEAAARCKAGGFVWLGHVRAQPDELTQVSESFGLHELAVEDAQTFHLRPKVEPYEGDIRLVILRTARYDDEREEVDFGEVSVFVGPAFVITVRQGVASDLHGARIRLEQRPELLEAGTSSVLWAILDQVVDGYGPVVAELERDIEQVEQTVFAGTVAPTERIYFLRREVTDFYRAVHPLLAVLVTHRTWCAGHRAAAVLPRRARPPGAGQRGGRRATRPARHRAGGEHGGDLASSRPRSASGRTRRSSS